MALGGGGLLVIGQFGTDLVLVSSKAKIPNQWYALCEYDSKIFSEKHVSTQWSECEYKYTCECQYRSKCECGKQIVPWTDWCECEHECNRGNRTLTFVHKFGPRKSSHIRIPYTTHRIPHTTYRIPRIWNLSLVRAAPALLLAHRR